MENEKQVNYWKWIAIAAICLLLVVCALHVTRSGQAAANAAPVEPATASANLPAAEPVSAPVPEPSPAPVFDPLSLWTETAPLKQQLIPFVEAAVTEGDPGYIPVERRIAVFDFDGTLFCETDPNYFDYTLLVHRVLEDPDYIDKASAYERETALQIVEQNEKGTSFEGLETDHGKCIASSFAGMTPEEFYAYVQEFKKTPMPSYEGMTRGGGWYLPMLEVIDYLEANDFTVFIISGTDRLIVRGIAQGSPIDLPMHQIIGSDESLVASHQDGADGLQYQYDPSDQVILGGDFIIKNLKMNKVSVIMQEIGVQPVLSFGNSTGDTSMENHAITNNPYPSLAFMLCCDDLERENGNLTKAENMYGLSEKFGWIPVSMKNDWTTIYGDSVTYMPAAKEEPAAAA